MALSTAALSLCRRVAAAIPTDSLASRFSSYFAASVSTQARYMIYSGAVNTQKSASRPLSASGARYMHTTSLNTLQRQTRRNFSIQSPLHIDQSAPST